PVARAGEDVAGELDEAVPPQPAIGPEAEASAGPRPELGRQDAEGQVGIRHEAPDDTAPRLAVSGGEPLQLLDVSLVRGAQNGGGPVRCERRGRELGVQV